MRGKREREREKTSKKSKTPSMYVEVLLNNPIVFISVTMDGID